MKKILFEIFLIIMLTVFLYHSVKYNMQTPEQTEIAHNYIRVFYGVHSWIGPGSSARENSRICIFWMKDI